MRSVQLLHCWPWSVHLGLMGRNLLGTDLHQVLPGCSLPALCRRAVFSLIPKKGRSGSYKNWRPVSPLCVDYKLLSRVLANRLKDCLELTVFPKGL